MATETPATSSDGITLLGTLGSLVLKPTPADRNVAFLPDLPPLLVPQPLVYAGTGADRKPDPALPLLYLLVGPEATPMGTAERFVEAVRLLVTSTTPIPTVEEAAAILFAFNGWDTIDRLRGDWNVGCLVALPIQAQPPPAILWNIELPSASPAVVVADPRLFLKARALEGADPLNSAGKDMASLRTKVQGLLRDYVGPGATLPMSTLGAALARRLSRNPYEGLFTVIEALAQLPDAGSAGQSRQDLAAAVVTALSAALLAMVASTSAGQAVLRLCFKSLPAGAPRNSVTNALEQPVDGAGAFFALHEARPGRAQREPPLCKELKTRLEIANGKSVVVQQFTMVFARRIAVGPDTTTHYPNADWTGPAIDGETKPEDYFDAHTASLAVPLLGAEAARARQRWDARMRVVLPLGLNEGMLEGLRMADKAFASIGFQQWSFHVNEEGTVLLERLKGANAILFDVFFGSAGLETALCDAAGAAGGGPSHLGPANPDAHVQAADGSWTQKDPSVVHEYYPSYVTLFGAQPGEQHALMPESDMERAGADRARFAFFGFKVAREPVYSAAGKVPTKGSFEIPPDKQDWGARFRLALLTVPEWAPVQFQQAAYRCTQLQNKLQGEHELKLGSAIPKSGSYLAIPNWCGHSHTVPEMLGSEVTAAMLLDAFINGRGLGLAIFREAWRRTQTAYMDEGTPPASLHGTGAALEKLNNEVLYRFALALAGVRRASGFDPDVRTTRALFMMDRLDGSVYFPQQGTDTASGRSRQEKFKLLSNPASFKGWD